MRITCYTDTGPLRPDNQDALLIGADIITHTPQPHTCTLQGPGLVVVADGMGGTPGGDIAALIVLRSLIGVDPFQNKKSLAERCELASHTMRSHARKDPVLRRMGAVMAGVAWNESQAVLFNCGDCRVYYASPEHLVRLTRDHSEVQHLYEQHLLDDETLRQHPRRHILTSAISTSSAPQHLFLRNISLSLLGRLFLCSDGVWEALSVSTLRDLLAEPDPTYAATRLAHALATTPASDNISFILLDNV